MSLSFFAEARVCSECAKNRKKMLKHFSELKLFPDSRPLEYATIDLLDELPLSPWENKFLLEIVGRFSKLTRAVLSRSIC